MGQREGALSFPVPAASGLAEMAVSSHAQTKRSQSAWEVGSNSVTMGSQSILTNLYFSFIETWLTYNIILGVQWVFWVYNDDLTYGTYFKMITTINLVNIHHLT